VFCASAISAPESVPHELGLGESTIPLLVDAERCVLERLELALARHVRPGLMRMAREEKAIGDTERRVVGGKRVRRPPQVVELDHNSVRTVQRSGKTGWESVVRR
jgi:hypothetical protein